MVRLAFSAISVAALVLPVVRAGVHEVWWDITYVQDVNPDGLQPRRVIGVNNTWPPPPVEVSTNDTYILHATNRLDEPTAIHHHGMFFNATPWYDGAMQVTQCGIPPNETFSYVVPINSSGQWGTYWVHAHSLGQYTDGLRAPFILHPPTEVHNYDEEFTVVLGDWYHTEQPILLKQFLSIANPGGAEPVPDAALIYYSQNATYLPGFNENATLPFEVGKTYRLRIVNTSAFSMFFFWIEGHDMRIIEVDGTDVEEAAVDMISITAAQRYSILVTARNDTSANWAIHANMDTDMFDDVPPNLNPNATSSVTYAPGAPLDTSGTVDAYTDTVDIGLVPIPAEPQLPPATHTIPLLVVFDTTTAGNNRAMFNNVTYNSPVVPGVFSMLSLARGDGGVGADAAVDANAYGPWSYVLNDGDVIDLVVMNSDAGKHPFHLHGHKFQIVNRADDYTSDDPTLNPPLEEGQANPIRRDTVQVPSGSSATLRFVADNPGVWFFHCHIEWHLEAGLAITLIASPQKLLQSATTTNPVPQFVFDQCAALGVPTTGNAAGHNSTSDLSGLNIGPFLQNNGWHARGIGAMTGCVASAVLGMLAVAWYALGGQIGEEEAMEEEQQRAMEKEKRGGLLERFRTGKA